MICPEADVKLYVTASAEVRARRRFDELQQKGESTAFETVLDEVRARDARDAGRSDAPMRAAADAVVIDTTEMDIDAAVTCAVDVVEARLTARWRRPVR